MTGLRIVGVLGSVALALSALACNNSPTTPDDTTPPGTQKTENYSGSLGPGETKAFHFAVESPGAINVAITSLSPMSGLTMGLRIGAWEAATESCPQQVFSGAARLNLVLTGNPQGPGEYCVAIYDVGNLQAAADFGLTVTHF
jgi:hypothetical protein